MLVWLLLQPLVVCDVWLANALFGIAGVHDDGSLRELFIVVRGIISSLHTFVAL